MISIKSLTKSFGHNIISNFSYEFASSSIYFLSGKNGAGKTTLLKLLMILCQKTFVKHLMKSFLVFDGIIWKFSSFFDFITQCFEQFPQL